MGKNIRRGSRSGPEGGQRGGTAPSMNAKLAKEPNHDRRRVTAATKGGGARKAGGTSGGYPGGTG